MKHIKMVIYGEPGVGKSVFASKAPKPFFITTDGNYEFLEDFGAKEEDHIQVNTWAEAKKAFVRDFSKYETIVVDLTEDLFKWCEYEYCKLNGYEHVSDPGFAKGYDITRTDFFINICKVLNQPKHVILIMHGITTSTKDRRGIDHTKYCPTNRLPDKVLDMIEGRVRYFLRAYLKAEDVNGKLIKKRYLSLVPKENEYGILRGIDEDKVPSDIPLDFATFAKVIGLNTDNRQETNQETNTITTTTSTPYLIKEPIENNNKVVVDNATQTISQTIGVEVKDKSKMLADIKAKLLAMQNKNK